jgi:predicted nucleotidyltransferase
MRDRIIEELRRTAEGDKVRILYACESGSRAWGFASPDSDYDVRFLYSHGLDWYLRLGATPDTIEHLDDVTTIDLAGWELRKALRLFAGCNPTLNEWLGSPIVYTSEQDFLAALRDLVPVYFNPRKAIHHYLSLAGRIASEHLKGDTITIKKAFYILRPLAAAAWIRDTGGMPPTEFSRLLEETRCEQLRAIRTEIEELVRRKATAAEKHPIELPRPIALYIHHTRRAFEIEATQVSPSGSNDLAPLEELMRRFLAPSDRT